ncbi:MAG TPA: cytochrome P450 [Actinophytocola sp.]|uniref:cytochrome P450 n=1 Tax=Actinophytocola sp. TaxID=1872138 RepID=UPI002DDD31E2|nr:cytochrome P450 [Actinophytocola sp.]HEV2783694.1 cytochrome P450 [Actinophytocola sp.]
MAQPEFPVFPFDTPPQLDHDPKQAWLRRWDPVPRVRLAPGGEAFLVTRYEDVKRVYADPVFSRAEASKPGTPALRPQRHNPHLLISMDPPEHTRVRRLVARAFTKRGVERMRPRIRHIADELIDAMMSHGAPVDFVNAFAAPLPAIVISELVGAPSRDHARLREWMDTVLSITSHTQEQIRSAGEHMVAYLGKLIAAKRAQPADDLLTELIQTRDGGDSLSEPELLFTTYIMLIGGYETTAGLLANSILTLHRHPDQYALLRDKPELIATAVEEILRYVPIAKASMERVATADVELSGVHVPAGSVLIPLQYSGNRDEALTADPDRFDVTRTPAPHLAFGHGIHHCLGAQLARLELEVAYTTLFDRLPELRPAEPRSIVWKRGMITRGPVALPVTW